jgi:hypothetical protein
MRRLTFLLVLLTSLTKGQSTHDGLVGAYESKSNGFEWSSVMILEKKNRFTYTSALGGCQTEVKGTWTVEDKKLKFTNDKEFTDHGTILYPNLGLTTWTIKKTGIKPDGLLDKGFCFKDDKLHRKR